MLIKNSEAQHVSEEFPKAREYCDLKYFIYFFESTDEQMRRQISPLNFKPPQLLQSIFKIGLTNDKE